MSAFSQWREHLGVVHEPVDHGGLKVQLTGQTGDGSPRYASPPDQPTGAANSTFGCRLTQRMSLPGQLGRDR